MTTNIELPARASLWAYVDHWQKVQPEAPAILYDGKCWSWSDLAQAIESVTSGLYSMGHGPGDRIAMLSWQCVEFVMTYVAIERLGATFVGMSTRYQLPELTTLLDDAKPKSLIVSATLEGALNAPSVVEMIQSQQPGIENIISLNGTLKETIAFDEWLTQKTNTDGVELPHTSSENEAPICIVYTSGSSGRPKAARLPNRSLLHNYRVGAQLFAHRPFRAYSCHPIDHVGGLDRMYQTIMLGGLLVIDPRFDPHLMLRQTQEKQLTYWLGEATQYIKLAPLMDDYDLTSLRVVRYVGPLPETVLETLQRTVPLVMTSYGSSETCASLVYTDNTTTRQELLDGNVGWPIEGFRLRVVDNSRQPVVGETGELEVQSPWIFDGYGAEEQNVTTPLTDEGWFRTGDLFRENQDGSFTILGRVNDMFKSGGYNVHPAEVESVLASHPLVKEACVVGVPDSTFIAVGRAFVVLQGAVSIAELRAFLRERLAGYKVPKEIVVMDALPLLRNDKVDKNALKEMAIPS